ncbi:MAG: ComEC/Rec2 family competence protein, partial [Oscillospiraceae bacterium]
TGDKSELSKDVKMQFRQAGLSHILVVSGLHLGIIAGFATLLLGKIFKNKKFSTFLSILFVLAFICFTGFTPSTVRAGVVICFVLIGKACHFETDAVTSMALALILLLISNPYACLDAGLLLSFSSTLGLVFLSYFKHEYIEQLKTNKWFCFAKPFLVPLFVMVATLPVMIYINGNVSIVGILANIIVVPLLTPVLIMGVITLITAVLTGMSDIAFMFGFFEKVFIDIIRFFVNLANKVPYGTISVGGIYAFCICACIYGLAFFLYKNKKYKAMAVSSVSLFIFSIMFSFFVNYNCIKIAPVGNSKNPSVVISKNQKAFVIYKGSVSNIYAIDEYLQNNNLYSVDGIYDISQNENGDILSQGIKETKIYTVNNLFDTKTIFDDIIVTVKQQKHSAICIIDVAGYKLALNSGQVDFDEISPINVYIAGTSKPKNIICDTAIFTDGKSMYYDELNCKDKRLWQRGSYIWIRPEKAVKIVDK